MPLVRVRPAHARDQPRGRRRHRTRPARRDRRRPGHAQHHRRRSRPRSPRCIVGGTSLTRTPTAFLDEQPAPTLVRVINDGAICIDALYDNRRAGISGVDRDQHRARREAAVRSCDHGFADYRRARCRTDAPPYYTAADRPAPVTGGGLRGHCSGVADDRDRSRSPRKFVAFARRLAGCCCMLLFNTMVNGLGGDSAHLRRRVHRRQRPARRATTSRSPASGSAGSSRSRSTATPREVSFELTDEQPILDTTDDRDALPEPARPAVPRAGPGRGARRGARGRRRRSRSTAPTRAST